MKQYEAPQLFVDEYAADTMIASADPEVLDPKNGNPGNNQNCWGCRNTAGATDPNNPTQACAYTPGDGAYEVWCQ